MKTIKSTRKTKHQKAVMELLDKSSHALTADEIIDRLSEKINKTTVYRMLERFMAAGKVHFITGQNGKAYYAMCENCGGDHSNTLHNHFHFQCTNCGEVECLQRKVQVPGLEDYEIHETQFLLIGLCKNCKK